MRNWVQVEKLSLKSGWKHSSAEMEVELLFTCPAETLLRREWAGRGLETGDEG